ncbi:MAG: transposase [Steroidobacteraceae bacterium]
MERAAIRHGCAPIAGKAHESREVRIGDAKQRWRPDRLFDAHSEPLIVRSGTPLGRRPGDDGVGILIQRFGSALNLNVHLHMMFVAGAYRTDGVGPPAFCHVPAPGTSEL